MGGVPAHFIMTVEQYAEKCLLNNPHYDKEKLQNDKVGETLRITE